MPADRETSAATTQLVLEYVRERLGEQGVRDVVAAAGIPCGVEELRDPSQWFSYDVRVRLFEAATAAAGDPDATFHIGASALRNGLNPGMVALLRALGSPRQVYRSLPRAVGKFSTTSTMRVLDLGRTHATIHYQLHPGYAHSRLDCRYAQGLFSVVPEIFGLPPARIVHDECESDGAPACLYHVTWSRPSRWHRTEVEDPELLLLRQQLDGLHSVASDLVGSDAVEEVLQRITERAASAVLAPGYLLAVERPEGGEPLVFSVGLEPGAASRLAPALLAGDDLGCPAVVVDVASTRRHHGRLAALLGEGQLGLVDEQRVLGLYAQHAAVALDLLDALSSTRRGEARATALLGLSHQLSAASGVAEVAELVARVVPSIVGATQASVMLWDAAAGELRTAAVSGLGPAQTRVMMEARLRPDEVPELVEMLARRRTAMLEPGTSGPVVTRLLEDVGSRRSLVVPLLAGDELLGVASAGWETDTDVADLDERIDRLVGVADQAATALHSARLVEAIEHQSLHDELTTLPNRTLLGSQLEQALRTTPAAGCVALLFCDLDRFKQVNDLLGHAAGDELLRQVAARLRASLRPGDAVGRLSGDEFAVLLPQVADVEAAEQVAERVVRCFDVPFRIEGRELRVTTSVGVAVHTGPDGRGDRLLREADGAMYVAKQRGRNQIARSEAVPAVAGRGPSLERELAVAVAQGQLRLHYQPVVALRGDGLRLTGAEALLRWEHPRLGLLAPAAFLPVAEDTGLVVELDLWALRTACAQARRWADDPRLPPVQLAVNLAARTLTDHRLVRAVRAALTEHDVRPELLCVEVVESASLVDLPTVTTQLQELRQMGVRTALDDFGTGFSTLSWLQHLPVDRIKLDRSFTSGLPDPAAATLVRGVVALAGELGLEVVAEGVETAEQLASLKGAGCLAVQGYLVGRPEPELRPLDPRVRGTSATAVPTVIA